MAVEDWIYPASLLISLFVFDPLIVLAMGVAIYIITPLHELGHYVAAKAMNIQPKNVFLNFNLFSLFYIYEHNTLGLMAGSHKRSFKSEGFVSYDDDFLTLSGFKQAIIYLAGPIINLIVGFGCLISLFFITANTGYSEAFIIFILFSTVLNISTGLVNLNIYQVGNDGYGAMNALIPDYVPTERFI